MKHNYLLPIGILVLAGGILFQSNSSGPANNGNRATGAPGDGGTTCVTCHSGGSFGTVNIGLTINTDSGNAVTEYMPGATYSLAVDVSATSGTPSGYGFQMIALQDAGNTPTNSFQNAGSGVQLSTTASRQYAEHTSASGTGSFTVDWVAPASGAGDVTFYIGANAVNGNGINGGDNATLFDLTIAEMGGDTTDTTGNGDPNGLFDATAAPRLSVFPNPAVDVLQVNGLQEDDLTGSVYSLNGQLVKQTEMSNGTIDVADLESGVYVLFIGEQHVRFVKQ